MAVVAPNEVGNGSKDPQIRGRQYPHRPTDFGYCGAAAFTGTAEVVYGRAGFQSGSDGAPGKAERIIPLSL
jgi:hypothetical protein